MARQFQMPESLDIGYKFFGGRFTFKDMLMRAIGLVPGAIVGVILHALTKNYFIAGIPALIIIGFGYWVGAKKVFKGTVPLLTAIKWQNEMARKTEVLFNFRDYEGTTPSANSTTESSKGGAD